MKENICWFGKTIVITLIAGLCILLLLSGLVIAWGYENLELADNEAAVWYEVTETLPFLTVITTSPENSEVHVNVGTEILVTFDRNIASGSGFDFITVEDEADTPTGIHSKVVDGMLLTIMPEKLAFGTTYTVTIPIHSIVALSHDNITLEADYSFSFTTGFAYGDVTGSGNIDVGDAIVILRHIVALADIENLYGPEALIRADVSGDGSIDVGDAILVLRYIVGLISEFPVEQ